MIHELLGRNGYEIRAPENEASAPAGPAPSLHGAARGQVRPVRPEHRVRLHFPDVERGLDVQEAMILTDWLSKERSLAAQKLAERLLAASQEETLELDTDELVALRSVLCETDTGDYAGLEQLGITVGGPALGEGRDDSAASRSQRRRPRDPSEGIRPR